MMHDVLVEHAVFAKRAVEIVGAAPERAVRVGPERVGAHQLARGRRRRAEQERDRHVVAGDDVVDEHAHVPARARCQQRPLAGLDEPEPLLELDASERERIKFVHAGR